MLPLQPRRELKKSKDFGVIEVIVFAEPEMNAIIQEKSKTTTVRNAVAISESVFLMPHLANTEATPAKTAERIAVASHNIVI